MNIELNIQNKKLELIQWLSTLEDSNLIEKIMELRKRESKDWWNSISENEKQAIEDKDHIECDHISEEFLSAIQDFSKVITLEPKHDVAYLNRALAYARKARLNKNIDFITKSIADFEKAISLNWENGYLYKQKDEMEELLEGITS